MGCTAGDGKRSSDEAAVRQLDRDPSGQKHVAAAASIRLPSALATAVIHASAAGGRNAAPRRNAHSTRTLCYDGFPPVLMSTSWRIALLAGRFMTGCNEMSRLWLMKTLLIALALLLGAGQVSAEIIPSDRRITWSPGVRGGIPKRTDVINVRNAPYNASGNGTTDDRAAIQNAIDAALPARSSTCPEGPTASAVVYRSGRASACVVTGQTRPHRLHRARRRRHPARPTARGWRRQSDPHLRAEALKTARSITVSNASASRSATTS